MRLFTSILSRTFSRSLRSVPAGLALALPVAAQQDVSFSVDWHGVLKGTPSTLGARITEGDILGPLGGVTSFSAPVPEIVFTGGFLGLVRYPICEGSGPGTACGVELDALSYGKDLVIKSTPSPYRVLFTTDEYVVGDSTLPVPSIATEAPGGDACADIFTTRQLPPPPLGPNFPQPRHVGFIDGNGEVSASGALYPGLGVTEPNVPGTGLPDNEFDLGDNVDAFDIGELPLAGESIYFSVDGGFFDFRSGRNNSGTAGFQNVDPGDVLRRLPNGNLVVYALADQLGLDKNGPPGSDDLDALILAENGVDGYQVSENPFDWEGADPGAPTDMLLFSVRRGSAVIGKADSGFGIPIVEGDILTTPVSGGNGNPAIFIAAEALGLNTDRGGLFSDDLNGADTGIEPYKDCNENGVEDGIDIGNGDSRDDNENGIPDECEEPGPRFCFCPTGPCGNDDALAGCANSTGVGADLDWAGTSSIEADDLVLTTTQMPTGKFGIMFMGAGTTSVFLADGIRCVDSGGAGIFRFPVLSTGASGSFSRGPGIAGYSCANFPASGCITMGATWNFQSWYRDIMASPCGTKSNISNAVAVTFTP